MNGVYLVIYAYVSDSNGEIIARNSCWVEWKLCIILVPKHSHLFGILTSGTYLITWPLYIPYQKHDRTIHRVCMISELVCFKIFIMLKISWKSTFVQFTSESAMFSQSPTFPIRHPDIPTFDNLFSKDIILCHIKV